MSRTQPSNVEAEKALIGSILLRPGILPQVAPDLTVDEFMDAGHREIWEAILTIAGRHHPVDYIAIADELKNRGVLGRLKGGETYLVDCANATPTAENAAHYARIVGEKAALRRLIYACAEVGDQAYGDVGDHDAFMREVLGRISRATLREGAAESETLAQTFERLQVDLERSELGQMILRIPTGIEKLDRLMDGGMAAEHLVMPISATSIGKSSLGFQIAFRGAHERRIPALIFSLEMSRAEAFVKGACTLAKVNTNTFAAKTPDTIPEQKVNADRWATIQRAGAMAANLSDLVRIEEHRHLGQIVAVASAWRARHPGPAVILVDHLQKVRGVRGKGVSRQEEVWGVAQVLKDLARDLKVPVIVPGQVDNDSVKEKRAPRLGDTRDSKAAEHEADVVIGLHRERNLATGKCELLVLKHRGGRVGKVTVRWQGEWQGFETPTPEIERMAEDDAE